MGINTTVIPKQINLSDVVDNETITYDVENNKLKVNIDNDTLVYDSTLNKIKLGFSTFKKLQEITLTSSQSNITISSLDINKHKVYKIYLYAYANPSSYAYIRLFFNNDTSSSSYFHSILGHNDDNVIAENGNSATINKTSNYFNAEIDIIKNETNYYNVAYTAKGYQDYNNGSWVVAGYYKKNVSNITQIDIKISTGSFLSGSKLILLGLTQ